MKSLLCHRSHQNLQDFLSVVFSSLYLPQRLASSYLYLLPALVYLSSNKLVQVPISPVRHTKKNSRNQHSINKYTQVRKNHLSHITLTIRSVQWTNYWHGRWSFCKVTQWYDQDKENNKKKKISNSTSKVLLMYLSTKPCTLNWETKTGT